LKKKKNVMKKQKKIPLLAFALVSLGTIFAFDAKAAGTATVSWIPPTTNVDDSSLTDLDGFRVYYGTESNWADICPVASVDQYVDVANPAATNYTFSNLTEGQTYYFTVVAYDTSGNLSGCASNGTDTEVSKFIPLQVQEPQEPQVYTPIYRFWSDQKQGHFYTASADEKNYIIATYPENVWKYEGEAYNAVQQGAADSTAIYRFWSDQKQHHFYTASEDEKNYVIANYPENVWKYEGIAYYAYAGQISNTNPLYRFWSDTKQGHFYTASEDEKNYIMVTYPTDVWKYEGIAWYVPTN